MSTSTHNGFSECQEFSYIESLSKEKAITSNLLRDRIVRRFIQLDELDVNIFGLVLKATVKASPNFMGLTATDLEGMGIPLSRPAIAQRCNRICQEHLFVINKGETPLSGARPTHYFALHPELPVNVAEDAFRVLKEEDVGSHDPEKEQVSNEHRAYLGHLHSVFSFLDDCEKKILYHLDKEGELTNSELRVRTGKNSDVIQKRLANKLMKKFQLVDRKDNKIGRGFTYFLRFPLDESTRRKLTTKADKYQDNLSQTESVQSVSIHANPSDQEIIEILRSEKSDLVARIQDIEEKINALILVEKIREDFVLSVNGKNAC